MPDCASSARITVAPRSGAGILASEPPNLPMAVRVAWVMTMSAMVPPEGCSKGYGREFRHVNAFDLPFRLLFLSSVFVIPTASEAKPRDLQLCYLLLCL